MNLRRVVGALLVASAVSAPIEAQAPRAAKSVVAGSVFDSVAGRPLAGARVQLLSTTRAEGERSATTDAIGRFRFDSVAFDTYMVSFIDDALDSLGLDSPISKIEVRDTVGIQIAMAVASPNSIIAFNCRNQDINDGMFIGFVRSAVDRSPVANAKVRVRWSEFAINGKNLDRRRPFLDATTDSRGYFTVCKIPADPSSAVQVRSWSGRDSSGFVLLEVPTSRMLRRDIYIGKSVEGVITEKTNDKNDSTVALPVVRGDARVRGTIRTDGGRPVPNARLTVNGTGIETLSKADGTYLLSGVPSGTYAIESRAIGFMSGHQVVDITSDGAAVADLVVGPQGRFLDTVRVLGKRPGFDGFAGFDRRSASGRGRFLNEAQINKIKPFVATDLVRSLPGVFVTSGAGLRYKLRMTGLTARGVCTPSIFVDGLPMDEPDDFDRFIQARDIIGVEVYNTWPSTPPEFMDYRGDGSLCGAVVVWTRQVSGPQRNR